MGHNYVKENETFNTSENGVVPKPTQADVNAGKVLKADGTWGEGGGGGTGDVEDVYVNGESVVDDEDKIARITSYKEVTQNEYIALPASKTSDGVLYCIKDAPSGIEGFPPLIYSDEEREIGVWRDGKPLYQKTIDFGYLPSDTATKAVAHGISNLGRVVSVDALGFNSSGVGMPIPKVSHLGLQYIVDIATTDTTINITCGMDRSSYYVYVTITYTKTTDTPGSGTWTTQGALAHNYSIAEHIVGTWIDGKPLYEKAFNINAAPNSLASNWLQSYNVKSIKFGFIHTWSGNEEVISHKFSFNTQSRTWSSSETLWADYIILQYTKTTD